MPASWRTWAILTGLGAIVAGALVYSVVHPPPDAVHPPLKAAGFILFPIMAGLACFTILVTSYQSWRAHAGYLVPQDWVLGESSVEVCSQHERSTLPWTTYTRFKETPWSFILWNPVGGGWILFPKRAFASPEDLRDCRALLARHLRPSRWFFG